MSNQISYLTLQDFSNNKIHKKFSNSWIHNLSHKFIKSSEPAKSPNKTLRHSSNNWKNSINKPALISKKPSKPLKLIKNNSFKKQIQKLLIHQGETSIFQPPKINKINFNLYQVLRQVIPQTYFMTGIFSIYSPPSPEKIKKLSINHLKSYKNNHFYSINIFKLIPSHHMSLSKLLFKNLPKLIKKWKKWKKTGQSQQILMNFQWSSINIKQKYNRSNLNFMLR